MIDAEAGGCHRLAVATRRRPPLPTAAVVIKSHRRHHHHHHPSGITATGMMMSMWLYRQCAAAIIVPPRRRCHGLVYSPRVVQDVSRSHTVKSAELTPVMCVPLRFRRATGCWRCPSCILGNRSSRCYYHGQPEVARRGLSDRAMQVSQRDQD